MILLPTDGRHYGHEELFSYVVEIKDAWGMNPFEAFMGSYNQFSLGFEMTYETSFQNCNCPIVLDCFYSKWAVSSGVPKSVCVSVMPGKPVRKENVQTVGLLS